MILVKEAKTKKDVLQAIFLRRKVLVEESKYSTYESEPDKDDLTSRIYVAKEKNNVIGTARVRKEKNIFRIQRMAIDKNYRKRGVGARILNKILRDFPKKKIYLMSPKSTIPFYEKFGFKKTSRTQGGKFFIYYRMQNY